jgi:hypothetical protein
MMEQLSKFRGSVGQTHRQLTQGRRLSESEKLQSYFATDFQLSGAASTGQNIGAGRANSIPTST